MDHQGTTLIDAGISKKNKDQRAEYWKPAEERARIKKTTCTYCNKIGHEESDCYKKRDKRKGRNRDTNYHMRSNFTLMTCDGNNTMKNVWVGDSGSTHHITNSIDVMYDIRTSTEQVTIRNRDKMKLEKIGK